MRFFKLIYIYYTCEVPKKWPCNFLAYLTYTKNKKLFFSSSKLTGAALQVIGPGGPGVMAADTAAKIKFDSCMHPVLIRYKLTKGKK